MNFNKYKNIQKPYDVDFSKNEYRKHLKKLLLKKEKSLGRSLGKIVAWHRGGGVKRNFRILYNNNQVENKYAILRSIEYDPNRSAFIGIIQYENGGFSNVVVSSEMKVNDVIFFSSNSMAALKPGDYVKLRYVPIGVPIYNLEKTPGSGAVYSKAAGVSSVILSKTVDYAQIKLPSGEEKLFDLDCLVTYGVPSNIYNKFHKKYKSGTNRLLNRRPTVRGTAMNPVDHPHGGGEGKTAPGRPSVSPWGKLTKGFPTRKKNIKNKFIVKRR